MLPVQHPDSKWDKLFIAVTIYTFLGAIKLQSREPGMSKRVRHDWDMSKRARHNWDMTKRARHDQELGHNWEAGERMRHEQERGCEWENRVWAREWGMSERVRGNWESNAQLFERMMELRAPMRMRWYWEWGVTERVRCNWESEFALFSHSHLIRGSLVPCSLSQARLSQLHLTLSVMHHFLGHA